MGVTGHSSNYQPGEPLRNWDSSDPITPVDAELIVKTAKAEAAVVNLVNDEPLTVEDELAFGSRVLGVKMWYEPMVMLIGGPQIDPAPPELLLEHTKVFRAPTVPVGVNVPVRVALFFGWIQSSASYRMPGYYGDVVDCGKSS